MSKKEELLALAARVERLSNPDREVDCLITDAIGGWPDGWAKHMPGMDGAPWAYHNPVLPMWQEALTFTASLDAAKTLVPKGWHVGMLTECDEDDSPSCCLTQNAEPCRDAVGRDAVGRGADMALSLVAAALLARAVLEEA